MYLAVKDVKPLENYHLLLKFENDEEKIFDMKPYLDIGQFKELKDKKLFSTLKVDKDLDTIVWDNGADLAPEFLYFKSFQNEQSLQGQFKEWGYI